MKPPKNIIIAYNSHKQGSKALAEQIAKQTQSADITAGLCSDYPIPRDTLKEADACCVIGGDGTILGIVDESARYQVPILGINQGKLGFLTTCSSDETPEHIDELIEGNIKIDNRSLLQCQCPRGGKIIALNDIVIKSDSPRLLRVEVKANGKSVNEYAADGLIFSTPTGSTAYNLSAGGPLIQPDAPVIAMTPICPHTLSNRSVIFSHNAELKIHLLDQNASVKVSKDGRTCDFTSEDFPLTIKTDPKVQLPLIVSPGHSHYQLIHDKLHWGKEDNDIG